MNFELAKLNEILERLKWVERKQDAILKHLAASPLKPPSFSAGISHKVEVQKLPDMEVKAKPEISKPSLNVSKKK